MTISVAISILRDMKSLFSNAEEVEANCAIKYPSHTTLAVMIMAVRTLRNTIGPTSRAWACLITSSPTTTGRTNHALVETPSKKYGPRRPLKKASKGYVQSSTINLE